MTGKAGMHLRQLTIPVRAACKASRFAVRGRNFRGAPGCVPAMCSGC